MEKKEKKKAKRTSKKNYYSPKLVIYGDIRRITQGTHTGTMTEGLFTNKS
jgi:hypothetical protein